MAAGYVYVLVNSSMPGLVKVGKTRRLPAERVQELSSATGVATPFVVAFEEPCDDCDALESAVHAELEERGFRQAQNREFFRATPNEVIRVILGVMERERALSINGDLRDIDEMPPQPWEDLMDEADALHHGDGDTFQDIDEAIRVYKLAARMGAPEACRSLGSILFFRVGPGGDHREALDWFKEGTKRGAFECYLWMARIFCEQRHFDNALKAFRKFFEYRNVWLNMHPTKSGAHVWDIEQYVHMCLDYRLPIEFPEFIGEARDRILSRVVPRLTDCISVREREELTRVQNLLAGTPSPTSKWSVSYAFTHTLGNSSVTTSKIVTRP